MAKPDNRYRDCLVQLAFTRDEKRRLQEHAREEGMPLAVWFRQQVKHITKPQKGERQ